MSVIVEDRITPDSTPVMMIVVTGSVQKQRHSFHKVWGLIWQYRIVSL